MSAAEPNRRAWSGSQKRQPPGFRRTSWFERAILVTLFIYEFFAFCQDQLTAVFGLAIVLITYVTIRVLVREEEQADPLPATTPV